MDEVENLILELQEPRADTYRIIGELGKKGDERAVEPLIGFLDHEYWEIYNITAKALGEIFSRCKIKNAELFQKVIAKLEKVTKCKYKSEAADSTLKIIKDKFLIEFKNFLTTEDLLAALKNNNEQIRERAAKTLGEKKAEQAVITDASGDKPLLKIAYSDTSEVVRIAAIFACGEIGANTNFPLIKTNILKELGKINTSEISQNECEAISKAREKIEKSQPFKVDRGWEVLPRQTGASSNSPPKKFISPRW